MTAREASPVSRLVLLTVSIALGFGTIDRNREYGSGLQLAETVLERFPTGVGHHVMAAELIAAGRTDEAVHHLYQAIPEAPRAYDTLGRELFKQGKLDEAIRAFEAFVRAQPALLEAVSARALLGRALAIQQRWLEAIQQYRMVLRMNPSLAERIEVQGLLADAHMKRGAYADAVLEYRVYLQSRPDDIGALTNFAMALGATDRVPEMLAVFQRAADLEPRNGVAQRNLANALFDHGDRAAAAVPAQRAVALRPDDPDARVLLGRVLAVQGQLSAAIVQFEQAIRLSPQSTEAREDLARALLLRGRPTSGPH